MTNDKKLEMIKTQKRYTAPGMYPGQNRARRFKNKKRHADKNACRGKVNFQ